MDKSGYADDDFFDMRPRAREPNLRGPSPGAAEPTKPAPTGATDQKQLFEAGALVWYDDDTSELMWPGCIERRNDELQFYRIYAFGDGTNKVPFAVHVVPYECTDAKKFWTKLAAELGPTRTQQLRDEAGRAANRGVESPIALAEQSATTPAKRTRGAEGSAEGLSVPAPTVHREQPARLARPFSNARGARGSRGGGRGRGASHTDIGNPEEAKAAQGHPTAQRARRGRAAVFARRLVLENRDDEKNKHKMDEPISVDSDSEDDTSGLNNVEDDLDDSVARSDEASFDKTGTSPSRQPGPNSAGPTEWSGGLGMALDEEDLGTAETSSRPLQILAFLAAKSYGMPRPVAADAGGRSSMQLAEAQEPHPTSTEGVTANATSSADAVAAPTTFPNDAPASSADAAAAAHSSDAVATTPSTDAILNAACSTIGVTVKAAPSVDLRLLLNGNFDDRLNARVQYLNQLVRLRRELAVLVRLRATSSQQAAQDLPPLVPEGAAYTLSGISASLFAIRPWELPATEKERHDAIANKIDAEEREHIHRIQGMARKVLPELTAGVNSVGAPVRQP